MDPRADLIPGGYPSPSIDAGRCEPQLPQGCTLCAQCMHFYSCPRCLDSHLGIEESTTSCASPNTGPSLGLNESSPREVGRGEHDQTGSMSPTDARNPTFADSHDVSTTSASEKACERLIGRTFALHEFPSLIEAIFSSEDEDKTIRSLPVSGAQMLIEVLDEALNTPDLSSRVRKKCLKLLYRTCGRHALLPRALEVAVYYDRTSNALYRGGYADVWKGKYHGRDVAVKAIRTYSNSELGKVINRFCKEVVTWRFLQHRNILPLLGVSMSKNQFAMISEWMDNGNINEFIRAHPDTNRLRLLVGVAEGLIYIHSNGMIHGDLKGANILIDKTGHARLADFGLLTIISDPTNRLSSGSSAQGGTVRWMSPELIAPEEFGFEKSRPTKPSDCYALGMVIYEVISGNIPFHEHTDLAVFVRVMGGKHPTGGVRFPKSLWKMLELCWAFHPKERPSVEEVLCCLEVTSSSPELPVPGVDEEVEQDDNWDPASGYSWISKGIGDAPVAKRGVMNRMGWRAGNATPGPEPTVSSWASEDGYFNCCL